MSETTKVINDIDRLFSEISINGETFISENFVPDVPETAVIKAPKPAPEPEQVPVPARNVAGENVNAVELNEVLHSIEDSEARENIRTKTDQLHTDIANNQALITNVENLLSSETEARQQADSALRADVESDINGIEELIPAQASSENKLADKDFVNSSIATNTAYFKGTFNSESELPLTDVTNNDYAFVIGTDSEGNTVYNRYKYNAENSEWVFEYPLNNSSFTAEQWSAINSGITEESVQEIQSSVDNLESSVDNLEGSVEDISSEIESIQGDLDACVKFTPQTLTDEQMAQARENIGVSGGGGSSNHFPIYELEDLGEVNLTVPSGSSSYNIASNGTGSHANVTRESGWVEILKGVECKISVHTWTTGETSSGKFQTTTVCGNITSTATLRQTKIDGYIPKGINLKQTSSIQVAGKTVTFGDTNNLVTESVTPFSTFPITLFTKTTNTTWVLGSAGFAGNVSGTLTIPVQIVPFNVKWF